MTIGRQAFRKVLLLICSALCLTTLAPSASSQAPPPVENPQATASATEEQQRDSDRERQQSGVQEQRTEEEEATDRDDAGQRRTRTAYTEERELAQPRAWLGIRLKEVSGDLAAYLGSTKGVLVESVYPDSPAQSAGIQVGDLIVEINGQPVDNPRALIEALLKLDDAQSPDAAREDAQRQEKEAEKRDDDQPRDTAKETEKVSFSPVKLKVLRQGKPLTVEVTPTERPKAVSRDETDVEPPQGKVAELNRRELEDLLQEMERQGGAQVFRFGPPATLPAPGARPAEERVESFVIVVKDASGESIEVRIERSGNEPPKITVREGDKTREISQDEIDQLPEKVRQAVRQALQRQQQARAAARSRSADARERSEAEIRERLERGKRDLSEAMRQRMEAERRLREQHRHQRQDGSQTMLFSPEELRKLGQSAQELAAKYQQLAEEMAARGVEQVQDLAAIPDEVKELRAQVDKLKKQVEELQAQAKADKQ